MRQNGTRQVFEYWNRLRGDRPAPARSEIRPAALGRSLAHIFILEAESEPFRFRLAGTWLGTVFGHEWTGRPFAELIAGDDRALAGRVASAVIAENAVAVIEMRADAAPDGGADLELVLLPLAGAPARIVGALHPAATPIWFGEWPLAPARLTSVRLMDADRPLFSLANRPAVPLPAAGHDTAGPAGRVLRVLEGGAAGRGGRSPVLRIIEGGGDPKRT